MALDTAEAVDNKGVGNIASAALQAGAKRVLLVSSIFVTKRRRFNPLRMLLNSMIWGMMDQKLQGEDLLRGSGLSYTVVRPSGLYNGPGGQHKLLVGQGDELSGRVSRADVADVCIAALRLPQAHNVTMEVIQGAKELDQPGQLDSLFTGLKADT
ncbi:hypothetical protein WJX72_012294 [[Myrmecia] bisecta]|uniref:NAD(P)-binding domain-containing protein n=1 Tax=[Myrmecia] bisecta TaxID=41462 RepID=A0AAW1Q4R2_9CHLO